MKRRKQIMSNKENYMDRKYSRRLYQYPKNKSNKNNKTKDEIEEKEWIYFSNLYKEENDNIVQVKRIVEDQLNNLEKKPSLEEVQEHISKLKNKKAPGSDTITAELIKHGGNYRTITLLNITYKILTMIISSRLTIHADIILRDYQLGYRNDKSTIDTMHTITQITDKCYEFDIDLHILFLDY